MSAEPYSFCFLRYHHDPLTGEFVNVGVLVWAPRSRYLGFKWGQKYRRLSQFFGGFHADDYRPMMSRIGSKFRKISKILADPQTQLPFESEDTVSAAYLAKWVIPHDDGAIRWSPSGGGLSSSPPAELEKLFHQSIGIHYEAKEETRRDERMVYRDVYRQAFINPVIRPYIREHEIVAPLASHTFPHAWKNGVWNVYEVISFDYKNSQSIDDTALKWGHRAELLRESPDHPKLHFLLGEPSKGHSKAYGNAKTILHRAGAHLVEEAEASDFASRLASEIQTSAKQAMINLPPRPRIHVSLEEDF